MAFTRITLLLLVLAAGASHAQSGAESGWRHLRDFWFDFESARIDATDAVKVSDLASYMKNNPTHRIALDGASEAGSEIELRRIDAIRQALITAGVPAYKIHAGAFGDARFRRARRVEVLVDRRE